MAAPALAARAPRIPKLTYRNQLPPNEALPLPSSTDPARSFSIPDSLDIRPSTTGSSTTTEHRPSSDSRSSTSSLSLSVSASLASSNGSATKSSKSSKKKKNGMLSFLTTKEPSQLAFQQYAEAQRKQASVKGGPALVGIQSVSLQKLPSSVPKVNSKWDGIPESAKSSKSSVRSSKRDSSSSHGSLPAPTFNYQPNPSVFSVASDGSRGPPNSLASPMASAIDLDPRRDSGLFELSESPPCSPPASSASHETYLIPDDCNAKITSHGEHPWSPPPPPPDLAFEAISIYDEEPSQEVDIQADAIFQKLNRKASGFLAGEAQEIDLGQESDDSDVVPDSHDFLFDLQPLPSDLHTTAPAVHIPQAVSPSSTAQGQPSSSPVTNPLQAYNSSRGSPTNFSRPRPRGSPYATPHRAMPTTLPTLYEASIVSTDTFASEDTVVNCTSLTDSFMESDDRPITPSTPTSADPRTSHHSRSHSSRDRLGLGGTIRKSEVLPWESQEQLGKPKKGIRRIF